MKKSAIDRCPCGLDRTFDECCGRWHRGDAAPSPESLMRARYAAYALGDDNFVLDTWHRLTRPAQIDPGPPPHPKWIDLQVLRARVDGNEGTVEFVARFRIGGRAHKLHEISRFLCEQGRWYYLDGETQ